MTEDIKHKTYFLWEEFKKWATRSLFVVLTVTVVALWSPVGNNLKVIWDSPERLTAIESGVDKINESMRNLAGEDRVFRQIEGLSYVEEPVYRGENIFLHLVVERTELGRDCVLTKAVPLFKDKTGITTPGTMPERDLISIATTDPVAVRLEYIPPPNLELGRVEVYVTIEYNCNGKTGFDKTDVLTYQLLDK
jgi:hypothetical protein